MPLHTTNDPGVRARHIADHEELRAWQETGDEKLSREVGARTYDEALLLFFDFIVNRHGANKREGT